MMRKTILTIVLTGIVVVGGVAALMVNSNFEAATAMAQTIETDEQADTAETVYTTEPTESVEEDSFLVNVEINTPYYSIKVPADWMGVCTIKTVNNETGMWLKLFRRDSGGSGGHLFSILLTDNDKYEIIPDHEVLGELKAVTGNKYHVVAVFPTDVQYSKEDRDNYTEMSKQADAILGSFEAAEGCVFVKAEN